MNPSGNGGQSPAKGRNKSAGGERMPSENVPKNGVGERAKNGGMGLTYKQVFLESGRVPK